MTKLHKSIAVVLGIFLLFEFSLYFAENDLRIWLDYGNPTSKGGLIVEILGELVAPWLVLAGGMIVIMYFLSERPSRMRTIQMIGAGACAVVSFGYCVMLFIRLKNIWAIAVGVAIMIGWMTGLFFLLKRVEPGRLFQLYCIAVTAILYCLAVLLVITLIKTVWGRVRPRDLETLEQFTPWYLPQGFTGNRSFPSGHTANASTLLVLTMFIPLIKNKICKVLLVAVPIIWIGCMIINRVYIGAHFASDTLFSLAISIALFFVVKSLTLRFIESTIEVE